MLFCKSLDSVLLQNLLEPHIRNSPAIYPPSVSTSLHHCPSAIFSLLVVRFLLKTCSQFLLSLSICYSFNLFLDILSMKEEILSVPLLTNFTQNDLHFHLNSMFFLYLSSVLLCICYHEIFFLYSVICLWTIDLCPDFSYYV